MRKIIFIAVCLLSFISFNNKANAQGWTLGGGITILAAEDYAFVGLKVYGGYEFNDKWAIGLMTGFDAGTETGNAIFGANVRFTPWHNDLLYIDIKGTSDLEFGDGDILKIGAVPSLRFRVAPKWEVFTDIGYLGVRGHLGGSFFPYALVTATPTMGVTYRF